MLELRFRQQHVVIVGILQLLLGLCHLDIIACPSMKADILLQTVCVFYGSFGSLTNL